MATAPVLAEPLRFQRLERIRARQRARRRLHLFLTTLVIALIVAGVLGFIAIRRTFAVAPSPTRADGVKRDATQPSRIQLETDPPARLLSDRPARGAVAPSHNEPHDAKAVDSTAAIDWLLKTSRSR